MKHVVIRRKNWKAAEKYGLDWASRVVRAAAFAVEAHAKTRAPVRTGRLRNSITTDVVKPLEAIVGPGVKYGKFVEFGTRYMAPRPYLRPAAEVVQKSLRNLARRVKPR